MENQDRPCWAFQQGRCTYGARCRYNHDEKSEALTEKGGNTKNTKKCHNYIKTGTCRFGDKCRFAHGDAPISENTDLAGRSPEGSRPLQRPPRLEDDTLRGWLRFIIKSGYAGVRPLSKTELSNFCQTSFDLVSSPGPERREQVISNLATEGGLTRIQEVIRIEYIRLSPYDSTALFKCTTLPLLQSVTHKLVISSLILESPRGTIFNFIFGPGGRRAVAFFGSLVKILSQIDTITLANMDLLVLSISSVSTALLQVIDCNQIANIIEEFKTFTSSIKALYDQLPLEYKESLLGQTSKRNLTSILTRLDFGSSIKPASETEQGAALMQPLAIFETGVDWPGELSENGPRHDNDHADISKIAVMPTADEIRSNRPEYLPTTNPTKWHHEGIAGILDRQFRLLREDTIGQLRDCVQSVLEQLNVSGGNPRFDRRTQHGARYLVYQSVILSDVVFEMKRGLQVVAEFDQPIPARTMGFQSDRQRWWSETKQLQVDSLLCLVDSGGKTVFMSVCQRNSTLESSKDVPTEPSSVPDEASISLDAARNLKTVARPIFGETQIEPVKDLWTNQRRCAITLQLIDLNEQGTTEILGRSQTGERPTQVLVEFPGVLLPSFRPTLEALKDMNCEVSGDIPFAHLIAPFTTNEERNVNTGVGPPPYSLQPEFRFDLQSITNGKSLTLGSREKFDLSSLERCSTLDEAQCNALVNALSRELALIQGPPGTGKSYVAIQLVKVLLACREEAELGPIICVCYTNHALDQFLEQIVSEGTKKIIRLGAGSKSKILEPFNLKNVTSEMETTRAGQAAVGKAYKAHKESGPEVASFLQDLKRSDSSRLVKGYLEAQFPMHFREVFRETDDDGFTLVRNSNRDPVQAWLHGGEKEMYIRRGCPIRTINQLNATDLSGMSLTERQILYQDWVKNIRESLTAQLHQAIGNYIESKEELRRCRRDLNLRCLEEAYVVGLTTSGLARNIDLLRRLNPKVVIYEEAGEILEAHTLTALLPSVEHAILIGDHEQLRPQIQNYDLSLENPRGRKYSLDVSLFERLIRSPNASNSVPHDTLRTQRRMDPSISKLIRRTLYPNLKDHESVSEYPAVVGMRKRLFWLDHREPEGAKDQSQTFQTSHWNDWEVETVAALVTHLVRQGVYKSEEIAVLTPYVRQLQKIRSLLSASFEIVVGDRDEEELEKQEAAMATRSLEDRLDLKSANTLTSTRVTLSQRLRLATVDNFQGEEANVIIVSLVRSNDEKSCGFLRTTNRINVLLSRARHGMYLIGNAETYSGIPMWADVIEMLKRGQNLGPKVSLCCPRHPDTEIEVASADDFSRLAPEGGCDLPCGLRLECGHVCTFKCHSKSRHEVAICQEPCPRRRDTCEHICPRRCGEACSHFCQAVVKKVLLPCGHTMQAVKCFQAQEPTVLKCKEDVEKIVPACGHKVLVHCCKSTSDANFQCLAICNANLSCGHKCQRLCKDCRVRDEDGVLLTNHGACTTPCGRPYTSCNHKCEVFCHGKDPCLPCTQKCQIACSHSRCAKDCREPCAPCAEACLSGCHHQGQCQLPCAVPCSVIPCSKRCTERLDCGHQCPSLCGERCPVVQFCQQCALPEILETMVDFVECSTYREANLDDDPVIIPACGHILTRSSMDGHMEMSQYYEMSDEGTLRAVLGSSRPFSVNDAKACPMCRQPLRDIHRYNRIVKRGLIDEATKRYIIWANNSFVPLEQSLHEQEVYLSGTKAKISTQPRQSMDHQAFITDPAEITLGGSRDSQIRQIKRLAGLSSRYEFILRLRSDVRIFQRNVREAEQPFGRVFQMVQDIQRATGQVVEFPIEGNVLRVRERLLATALAIRCDLTIFSDFIKLHQEQAGNRASPYQWTKAAVRTDFVKNREECLNLALNAAIQKQPMQEIEARVYFARYVILQRSAGEVEMEDIVAEAKEQLKIARAASSESLNTMAMLDEIKNAEKSLRDSTFFTTVTSDEKRAVYAAMAAEFRGTGHWYYCRNGHPFTVGECGMPMQTSVCPQCGAQVGGQSHQSVEGVTQARELDDEFGQLRL